jgi:hypothetical protein
VPPQGAPGGSGRPSTPREEAGPLGAQPRPRALEPAVTEAADSTAFWSTGKAKGSIFDALEDLDYQECLDKCVAISKA